MDKMFYRIPVSSDILDGEKKNFPNAPMNSSGMSVKGLFSGLHTCICPSRMEFVPLKGEQYYCQLTELSFLAVLCPTVFVSGDLCF